MTLGKRISAISSEGNNVPHYMPCGLKKSVKKPLRMPAKDEKIKRPIKHTYLESP
jgi:hypothetical protein